MFCGMLVSLQLARPCSSTLDSLTVVLDPRLWADYSDVSFGVLSFLICVSMAEPVAILSMWDYSGAY